MDRGYALYIAKLMAESSDTDNQEFGQLLLRIIPEDDRKIPSAVLADIRSEVERGIKRMSIEKQGEHATYWSQEEALRWIAGTPYVDDPRPGWTKRDLAMFARGYATGRAVQKFNDDETLNMVIMGLDRIDKNIAGYEAINSESK